MTLYGEIELRLRHSSASRYRNQEGGWCEGRNVDVRVEEDIRLPH
jgi:hypothetical protein